MIILKSLEQQMQQMLIGISNVRKPLIYGVDYFPGDLVEFKDAIGEDRNKFNGKICKVIRKSTVSSSVWLEIHLSKGNTVELCCDEYNIKKKIS